MSNDKSNIKTAEELKWWNNIKEDFAERVVKQNKAPHLFAIDDEGNSILHGAIDQGDTEFLTELAKKGLLTPELIDNKNDKGHTPLHAALYGGKSGAVAFLLKNGENVDAQDNTAETPLGLACRVNASKETIHALLSHSKNPAGSLEIRDDGGKGKSVLDRIKERKDAKEVLAYLGEQKNLAPVKDMLQDVHRDSGVSTEPAPLQWIPLSKLKENPEYKAAAQSLWITSKHHLLHGSL